MWQDAAATCRNPSEGEWREGLKKVKISQFDAQKKLRLKSVSRCTTMTSDKNTKTRDIEPFTSQEVGAASCRSYLECDEMPHRLIADGSGIRNTDRQEVGPKGLAFFEKNGIPAFPSLSRFQKPQKNGLVSFGKSIEK
jgi:hypothetical protein